MSRSWLSEDPHDQRAKLEESFHQSTQREKVTLQATIDHLKQSCRSTRRHMTVCYQAQRGYEDHEKSISTVRMEMAESHQHTTSAHRKLDERRNELLADHQAAIDSLKRR